MTKLYPLVAIVVSVALLPVKAATISKSEAQRRVTSVQKLDAEFLDKNPALKDLVAAVKADCSAKIPELAQSTTICSCGAAVTMELWRSGADPKMISRLSDYVVHPDPAHAADFLQYQGPELYRPLCEMAEP